MTREEIDAAITKIADQETLCDQPQVDRLKHACPVRSPSKAVPAVAVVPIVQSPRSRLQTRPWHAAAYLTAGRVARGARTGIEARADRRSNSLDWRCCLECGTCMQWERRMKSKLKLWLFRSVQAACSIGATTGRTGLGEACDDAAT